MEQQQQKPVQVDEAQKIAFVHCYFVVGSTEWHAPKGAYEIKNPPCAGYQHAFVLTGKGNRRLVFCPYTFMSFNVSAQAAEIRGEHEPLDEDRVQRMGDLMRKNWAQYCSRQALVDYDAAAAVFVALGLEVPGETPRFSEDNEPKKTGGKETAVTLLKPVKSEGRRAECLRFFLEETSGRSIREAMVKLDMTRSGVLTHLHGLNKVNGIGYEVVGDSVRIALPCPMNELWEE